MEFAIIAAGQGSRLREEGLDLSKPLLPICGVAMIERLIKIFAKNGAARVHIIVNSASVDLQNFLKDNDFGVPIHSYVFDTESSLHSLGELLQANPSWSECVVTTTDTIFSEREFADYIAQFSARKSADAYMGVTSFIDDESPLYIAMDQHNKIEVFSDDRMQNTELVSGGIYGLRERAAQVAHEQIRLGQTRMRNYQRSLLEKSLVVEGHVFDKIVDVDHLSDQKQAEAYLMEIGECGRK